MESLKRVKPAGCEPNSEGARSCSRKVPASVPLERHSSVPAVPSLAAKRSSPSGDSAKRDSASTPLGAPGRMSLTSKVPAALPSLFHSSAPEVPSSAVK